MFSASSPCLSFSSSHINPKHTLLVFNEIAEFFIKFVRSLFSSFKALRLSFSVEWTQWRIIFLVEFFPLLSEAFLSELHVNLPNVEHCAWARVDWICINERSSERIRLRSKTKQSKEKICERIFDGKLEDFYLEFYFYSFFSFFCDYAYVEQHQPLSDDRKDLSLFSDTRIFLIIISLSSFTDSYLTWVATTLFHYSFPLLRGGLHLTLMRWVESIQRNSSAAAIIQLLLFSTIFLFLSLKSFTKTHKTLTEAKFIHKNSWNNKKPTQTTTNSFSHFSTFFSKLWILYKTFFPSNNKTEKDFNANFSLQKNSFKLYWRFKYFSLFPHIFFLLLCAYACEWWMVVSD